MDTKIFKSTVFIFLSVIIAGILANGVCYAETLIRLREPVKITQQMIKEPVSAKNLPNLLRAEEGSYDMFKNQPQLLESVPGSCAHSRGSLCYDYRNGQAVYKPAVRLMPEIPGFTPSNLSIRRDKIVFSYTFK